MAKRNTDLTHVIARYCCALPIEIGALVKDVENAITSKARPDLTLHLASEFHRMGGTAQCMGFTTLGMAFELLNNELDRFNERGIAENRDCLNHVLATLRSIAVFSRDVTPDRSDLLKSRRAPNSEVATENYASDHPSVLHQDIEVLSQERILFADDDEHIREMMMRTLRGMGVEYFYGAASGPEVLDVIASFKPTFIITDWLMNSFSGLQLLQKIRNAETILAADTPVILFTSLKDDYYKQIADHYGADRLLTKPITPEDISEAVMSAIAQRFQHLSSQSIAKKPDYRYG